MTKPRPDRPLPANISAEKALLGALLLENDLFESVASLEPDDFSLDSHKRIFARIAEMIEAGDAVDIVTLVERMTQTKDLESMGETPIAYISDLSTDTIRYRPAVRDWARIIKGKSLQRRLIAMCLTATEYSYEGETGRNIIAFLRENLNDIEACANRGLRLKEETTA